MWRVSSRSGVATLRTALHLLLTYLLPGSRRGPPADENSGCAPAAVCSSIATVCPGRKMSGGREGGGPWRGRTSGEALEDDDVDDLSRTQSPGSRTSIRTRALFVVADKKTRRSTPRQVQESRGVDLCKNVGGSKLHSLLVK